MSHFPSTKICLPILIIFLTVLLIVFIFYPTVRMFAGVYSYWNVNVLVQRDMFLIVRNTILLAFASIVASGMVGCLFAWLITSVNFPGKQVVTALFYMPLALPPLVGVLAFYYLIGRDGIIIRALEQVFSLRQAHLSGFWTVLIVHTYSFFVFFYSALRTAFAQFDFTLIEAAKTLGASKGFIFRHVILPMIKPALKNAALLAYMSSCASFSAPLFFGENFPVLSVRIYEAASQFQDDIALSLTLLLALVSVVGVGLFRSKPLPSRPARKGTWQPIKPRALSKPAICGVYALAIAIFIPFAMVFWLSLVDHKQWHTELLPFQFTLNNYKKIFHENILFLPIRNSVLLSSVATITAVMIGIPVSYWIALRKNGYGFLNFLVMMPWALPGSVLAMNLIVASNDPWVPAMLTAYLLPIAYVIRSLPLFTRFAVASFQHFDYSLVEAARTLGARSMYRFYTVILPQVGPAMLASASLVFVTCLGEFVTSILLYRPENIPIAVQISILLRGVDLGSGFAYGSLLLVFNLAAFYLSQKLGSEVFN